jgi:hypothetical protein
VNHEGSLKLPEAILDDVVASERSLGLAAVDTGDHARNLNTGLSGVNERGTKVERDTCRKTVCHKTHPSCRKNALTFTDPFGLQAEGGDCKGRLDCAYNLIKSFAGKAIDKLTGGAPAALDVARSREPNTTRDRIADAVLNPPDPGSLDFSVTGYYSHGSLTIGTQGVFIGGGLGQLYGGTADVTYNLPGNQSGLPLSVGYVGGGALIGGVSVTPTSNGAGVASVTGSIGVGVGARGGAVERFRVRDLFSIPIPLFNRN